MWQFDQVPGGEQDFPDRLRKTGVAPKSLRTGILPYETEPFQLSIRLAEEIEGNSIPKILPLNVNCYAGSRFDCCNGLSHFIVNRQRGFRLQANNE